MVGEDRVTGLDYCDMTRREWHEVPGISVASQDVAGNDWRIAH